MLFKVWDTKGAAKQAVPELCMASMLGIGQSIGPFLCQVSTIFFSPLYDKLRSFQNCQLTLIFFISSSL